MAGIGFTYLLMKHLILHRCLLEFGAKEILEDFCGILNLRELRTDSNMVIILQMERPGF